MSNNTVQDPYLRHLFDANPAFNVYNPDVVNLSVGAPGPDLLKHCTDLLARSTKHRLEEEEIEGKYFLFQYGIPSGLWECRDELAKFLTRRYGSFVARENLVLTAGATHGLQLILNTLLAPNGIVFVDEVTYMIALEVFEQFPTLKIISVPMKSGVVSLDALEKLVESEIKQRTKLLESKKMFWALYYTVPTFHNPTGMSLTPDASKKLAEIAQEKDFLIVCDDVYNLLHYETKLPPRRLFEFDDPKNPHYRGGNVISNGSFSKILSPAIRVGWIECGPRIVSKLKESGILKSGGAVNHYTSGLIASLLQLGFEDRHLDHLITTYRERMKALCDTLDENLPASCSYRRPEGGYFAWIELPKDFDAVSFLSWCQEVYKVLAIPGSRFSLNGESKNCIRVSIAFHKTGSIQRAAKILCKAISEFNKEKESDF